ncbi:hypothetical protein BBP40_003403 [Aspergillus hancockii]|nr:hypothetical protein BBP40_003403 [Aspergillus hancockii]
MTPKKLIVILGATGNQGGSVAGAFLQEPEWRVRAVTRNPLSTKAQALAARGAEIVQADLDSPYTLSSAFENAHVIFADQPLNVWATNYKTGQLKGVIDAAAKIPTLGRFVLSSLSNATKWSRGKYTHVYHFDSKAKAEKYGRETYPELPKSAWCSSALVQESAGKNIVGYRVWSTLRELTEAFTQATGIEAEYILLPKGQSNIPFPPVLCLELDDNWAYCNEFGYEGRDDPTIIHPKDLASPPQLDSVVDYIRKQDWSKVFNAQQK